MQKRKVGSPAALTSLRRMNKRATSGRHRRGAFELYKEGDREEAQMADRRRIFSPFYTSKTSGTGLGLAISKKLVAAHGGTIEAHSSPGAGTEFVMTLPREQGEAARRPQ